MFLTRTASGVVSENAKRCRREDSDFALNGCLPGARREKAERRALMFEKRLSESMVAQSNVERELAAVVDERGASASARSSLVQSNAGLVQENQRCCRAHIACLASPVVLPGYPDWML